MRLLTLACRSATAGLLIIPLLTATSRAALQDVPWTMHPIVEGTPGTGNFAGSDGVATALVDADGLPDVASGYEQGSVVTISFNPGTTSATDPWPTIKLPSTGTLSGPEDANFGDVDDDGATDLIVGAEGGRRVTVFFAPAPGGADPRVAANWTRVDLQASVALGQRSMRVQVADVNEDGDPDIVVGGKEEPGVASVGYYTFGSDPRDPNGWTYHPIVAAGWVMQLEVVDMNGDGHLDIVYTDRDPIDHPALDRSKMGLRWLESSGGTSPAWTERLISPVVSANGERYHKWFSRFDWNGDGQLDVADCRSVLEHPEFDELSIWLNGGSAASWTKLSVPYPAGVGSCQHLTVVDVDGVGGNDLAFSCADAGDLSGDPDTLSGLVWLKNTGTPGAPVWVRQEIGGTEAGIKYDNLIWLDLDGDGDQDALTSEQHEDLDGDGVLGPGLGVVWYENPAP